MVRAVLKKRVSRKKFWVELFIVNEYLIEYDEIYKYLVEPNWLCLTQFNFI